MARAMTIPSGSIDAWRDIEQLELEFVMADLGVMEKRVEKLRTTGRHGNILKIRPPLAITADEAVVIPTRLGQVLTDLER